MSTGKKHVKVELVVRCDCGFEARAMRTHSSR